MTKYIRAAGLLVLASLGLAACQDEPAPAAAQADGGIAGLTFDGALILPAVKGRPGVVYGTFANSGDRNLAIRNVEVKGAGKTELHGSMEMNGQMTMAETGPQLVPSKGTMELKSGDLHVMVFDLQPSLAAGSITTLTITVAGGDRASFDIPVKAAGDPR